NGYDFKIYKHNPDDLSSIGANAIQTLFEDKQGNIWVGTFDGGLSKYDPLTEKFYTYLNNNSEPNSISSNAVYAICEDDASNLWIGTAYGLNKLNTKTQKFFCYYRNPSDNNSLSSDIISSLIFDKKYNVLWIGTKSGGVNKYDLSLNRFEKYRYDKSNLNSLTTDFVYSIFRDTSDILWIGTIDGGLNKLDIKTNKITVYDINNSGSIGFNDQTIISIENDNAGNLLLGTYDHGLMVYNKKSSNFYSFIHDPREPESIGDNMVNDIYVDESGLIWIGTWNDGLNKINPNRKFYHYKHNPLNPNSLSGNFVTALCEDKDGFIWIGTDQKGLNKFDVKNGVFTHFINQPDDDHSITSNEIADIEEDKEGTIWIAIDNSGFCKYEKTTGRFLRYKNDPNNKKSLPCDQISVLVAERNGKLLIGTIGGGLLEFDKKKNSFTRIRYDPGDNEDITAYGIYAVLEDSKERIWIGTYGTGLFCYDRKTGSTETYLNTYSDTTSISNNTISAIVESDDGTIWVGTYDGLNKFDNINKRFKRYNENNGLPNNNIYGIVIDESKNLWISTNKGLAKLNPSTNDINTYTKADGLQSDEFNQWAHCKGGKGNIYFGGINGFNVFNPSKFKDSNIKPKIVLTNLLLFNKTIPVGYDEHFERTILTKPLDDTKILELTHYDYFFSIEFIALDYISPKSIKYAYKLKGFDNEWIYVNADRRFATYTNLNPGEYTFAVKSTNSDGIWSDVTKDISIIVNPPWWKTGWAYSAYLAITLFLLYLLRTYDLRRQRLKHQLELEHEHAEKLEEVDRIKSRFFANISHEFRTPLTLILGPAEQILTIKPNEIIRKNILMIKKNANNMLNLINQLLDLSKIDSGRLQLKAAKQNIIPFLKGVVMSFESIANMKSIKLKLDVAADEISVYFDREKMETVLKNLLSNAFKFTPDGKEVTVSLLIINGSSVEIKVRDTGIGIDEKHLSKIFDRFYQVNDEHTREHEGSGIGLSLVKELVELHYGSVSVNSQLGEWTEFKITLPLGNAHLSSDEIVDSDDKLLIERLLIDDSEFVKSPEHKTQIENLPTDKDIILVVEDNSDVRKFIIDSLGDKYHFEEAENGEEGIKQAQA
ncbi:MAG TPA: two-component regulator propeller domain-containing protein, partial [Ignavibacteriaceae bacterium]